MKKILFTLAAALMMCFIACNPDNPTPDNGGGNDANSLVGNWRVDNMIYNGEDMTPDDMVLVMNANGTGDVLNNGQSSNDSFNWSVSDNVLTVHPNGGGEYTFTIVSITATECSLHGNVIPSTDIQGDVTMHLTNVSGGDNPGPGPNPANFPEGTLWQFQYDTSMPYQGISVMTSLTYSLDFINAVNCDMGMRYVVSAMGMTVADTSMVYPMTYTYNSTSGEGVFTIPDPESSESDILPFTYNSTDNTIIIDVPEEYFQDDDSGDDDEPDMPMPTHWVFHRIR